MSLRIGLRGSIAEGPLGLSSCWLFSSSRPSTVVEDLGRVSLGSGRSRIWLKVSTSYTGKVDHLYLPPYRRLDLSWPGVEVLEEP